MDQVVGPVVALDDRGDAPMTIRIEDPGQRLTAALAPTAAELEKYLPSLLTENVAVVSLPPDPNRLMVLWTGFACDRSGALTLAATGDRITMAPDPIENCELVPSHRGVVLVFSQPQTAGLYAVELLPTDILEES